MQPNVIIVSTSKRSESREPMTLDRALQKAESHAYRYPQSYEAQHVVHNAKGKIKHTL